MDPRLKSARAQLKKDLRTLEKAGLYKPKARGQVTDYGKRLVKRFVDVAQGRADTVRVPSRDIAKSYEQFQSKANRVIVPKDYYGKARYNKKEGAITKTRKDNEGGTYRVSITPKVQKTENQYPSLKKGETYAIPYRRGTRKAHYIYFSNEKELRQFFAEGNSQYKNIQDHVEIVRYTPRRQRKAA